MNWHHTPGDLNPPGLSVAVVAGGGVADVIGARSPEGRSLDFYHYTDASGFEGLTAGDPDWLPSLGVRAKTVSAVPFPGQPFPPESVRSRASLADALSTCLALAIHDHSALLPLASAVYGPGWYMTDVPPDRPSEVLLEMLWGGDERMRDRTAYWVRVRMNEFKARTPDPWRPQVRFVPILDACGESQEGALYAESLIPVQLVSGGSRVEIGGGRIRIRRLCRARRVIIPSYTFLINGWEDLSEHKRETIHRFLGTANRPSAKWPSDSEEARAIDLVHKLAVEGKTEEALRRADELIERWPRVPDLHSNRGAVLAKLGRRDDAVVAYRRALEIDPGHARSRINLSASLMQLGHSEQSLAIINDLLLSHPGSADGWFNRGGALGRLGEWRWAIHAFERVLQLAPAHPRAAGVRDQIAQLRIQNVLHWPARQIRRIGRLWRRF